MPDRIEREIEDILNKLDDFVPEKGQKPIPFRQRRKPSSASKAQGWANQRVSRLSLNQVMLGALLVAIAAYVMRSVSFANIVMLGALLTLVVAFVLSIRAGGGGGRASSGGMPQKRWRGEPLDVQPYRNQGPGFVDRIKGWFSRK